MKPGTELRGGRLEAGAAPEEEAAAREAAVEEDRPTAPPAAPLLPRCHSCGKARRPPQAAARR